ncbi:hypothetical protein BC2230_20144 [Burkholderia cepacia]
MKDNGGQAEDGKGERKRGVAGRAQARRMPASMNLTESPRP